MDTGTLTLFILVLAVVSFSTRACFISLVPDPRLPEWLRDALRFVPAAVVPALVVPEILAPGGALAFGPDNARLVAAAVAALVAWRTRGPLSTIIAGMLALHLWIVIAVR